jgi:hypothetical protein
MKEEEWRNTMKRNLSQLILVMSMGVLFASWIALPSLAQRGRPGLPIYNSATEVTMKGSVQAVAQLTGPRGWAGTHLSLHTDKETIDVHVGPSWYLTQQKISFTKGDHIEATGSRITFGKKDVLLARAIKKSGEAFTLRNSQGIPVWSGRNRRQAP